MALSRRSGSRTVANIWPGFVDAMTALLLVLFFVLSIFMVVQSVLRDQVTERDRELDVLGNQLSDLAGALGVEQQRNDQLETQVSTLNSDLADAESQAERQAALIATLTDQRDAQASAIASFEEQVAGLLARNRDLSGVLEDTETTLASTQADLENTEADLASTQANLASTEADLSSLQDENDRQISANAALNLALARARSEIDEAAEAARLAAARREAIEAMVADLESRNAEQAEALSEAAAARLADAAAAEALRNRLENANAELTAMTLSLEAERARAEETLTLLAAARAAEQELSSTLADTQVDRDRARSEAERRAALLAIARESLASEQEVSAKNLAQVEVLSQQTAALNRQLNNLQGLLDAAREAEEAAQVRIETLGSDLNTALAKVAAEQRKLAVEQRKLAEEQRRRADLEEAERKRLEEEARNLANYRSEFFGRVREILGDREGIRVVGDRFVFSSEVLFGAGSASLGFEGRQQLAEVADVIKEIQGEIPEEINWILRVDGHTDNIPISGGTFRDNWELSQARALSVVRYLIGAEGIPAERLAANGFGEFQPIDPANTEEARARNRRIELKFTER